MLETTYMCVVACLKVPQRRLQSGNIGFLLLFSLKTGIHLLQSTEEAAYTGAGGMCVLLPGRRSQIGAWKVVCVVCLLFLLLKLGMHLGSFVCVCQ